MLIHDPRWRCAPFHISPSGVQCSLCSICRGARCGFVAKAQSRQGGLAALRCILPHGARAALFSGARRMWALRCSFQVMTHV